MKALNRKRGHFAELVGALCRWRLTNHLWFVAALLAMSAFDLLAVPAHPKPAAVTQPDGSTIKLILRGDEFQHWHEDAAGYTILKDAASGFWLYASLDSKGVLAATSLVVGRDNPAKAGLAQHLKPTSTVKLTPAAKKARQLAPAASRTVITHGTMKNLVILVQFPDLKGNYTKADVEAALNTPGYAVDGAHGSVQDYYREASGNQLTIESVVTDWVTLDHSYKYYGTNDSSGNDLRPQEMVQDAIAKLAATKFDFTTVDGDNDGWVDGLTIIHAGRGEEQTGNDPNYIYAHEWNLNTPVTYGGKKLQDYLAVAEQRGWDNDPSSWGLFRIGGFCHEMGHFLGLPDLYDYTYTSEGVGNFCLMSGGLWNGDNGTYPSHPSAYCKKLLGWVVPTVVSNTGIYNVPQVESVPVIYQLSGNFAATEYFLIENRQGVGFDTGLPGSSRGLLIWHVDETIADNNNRNHYMVGLEEANGARDLANSVDSGDDDDYFRSGNKTQFTATTTPNNKSYSSVVLGLDITNVSATASNMTFSLKGPPPTEGFVFFRNATSSKIFAPLNTPGLATPSTVTLATYPNLRLALYYGDVGITNENQLLGRVAANGLLTSNLATDTNGIITMTATAGIYSDAGPATVGFKTPTTNAATFQVRAWNGGFGATWEAFQNNPDKTNGTFYGKTALFTFAPGVGTPKTLYADGTLPYFQLQSLFVDTTPPGITNQPASQTVMLGSNVTFQVNSIGVVPLSYQWYFNPGALLPGATNSFLTLNRVQVAQAGDYYVVVSNRYGAATSDLAHLTVITTPPEITNKPVSQTVTAGSNVVFQVNATGSDPLSYQWYFNQGALLSGATNSSLTLSRIQVFQSGDYYVVVTNPYGVATSDLAHLTIITPPPEITSQPVSQTVTAGSNVVFQVNATGSDPLSFQWYFNQGALLSGATNSSLTLNRVQVFQSGDYYVVVTNPYGVATSDLAHLTLIGEPVITLQPSNQSVLLGTTAKFSVRASGNAPLRFQWQFNGLNLTGQTLSNLTVIASSTNKSGNYTVMISNAVGTVTSQVATLNVLLKPTMLIQPKNLVAVQGGTATFTVGLGGSAPFLYQWLKNTAVIPGATLPVLTLTNLQAADAAKYSVRITNAVGNALSLPASLAVQIPPVITQVTLSASNQPVAAGTTVTFKVLATGTAPLKYQWLSNGVPIRGQAAATMSLAAITTNKSAGYSVVVTNLVGSATSAVTQLLVHQKPAIITQPKNQTILAGTNVTLMALVTGSDPLICQWRKDGLPLTGETNASLVITGIQTNQAGKYDLRVTNLVGWVQSATAILTVKPPPKPASRLAQPISLTTTSASTRITLTFTTEPGKTYQVQYTESLTPPVWLPLGIPRLATSSTLSIEDAKAVQTSRFYRLVETGY